MFLREMLLGIKGENHLLYESVIGVTRILKLRLTN
jgi:hypothetical protein